MNEGVKTMLLSCYESGFLLSDAKIYIYISMASAFVDLGFIVQTNHHKEERVVKTIQLRWKKI